MKTHLLSLALAGIVLAATNSYAQDAENSNPYAIFGCTPYVAGDKDAGADTGKVFVIENPSSESQIARMEHNPKTGEIRLFDLNGVLIAERLLTRNEKAWPTIDRKAEKYYSISPYAFCTGNPIRYIDPNGEDVYMYYYTSGNTRHGEADPNADAMFMAAALTKAYDMLQNGTIKEGDIAIFRTVSDLGQLGTMVENDVSIYSPEYGQTAEFNLWSHGALDGPIGTTATTGEYAKGNQMTQAGWGDIDFNFKSERARAMFYGCRTASNENGSRTSWAESVSLNENMKNVDVYGQTVRSWPSSDQRQVMTPGANGTYPTYMVGGAPRSGGVRGAYRTLGIPYPAYPMARYKNGGRH